MSRATRCLPLIAEFDHRDGWAGAGFSSCVDWLAWRTGITPVTARHQIRVAHALACLPQTSEAMRQGLVSYTKVREITRVATPETEHELLEYALSGSAVQLRDFVRGWKRMEREGEIGAEEVRHRSRKLSVVIDGEGMYVVRGRLEPEAGAALMRAVEAAGDAIYRDEDPEARPSGGPTRWAWWPSGRWPPGLADRALIAGADRGGPGPEGLGRGLARGYRPAPSGRAGRAGQGTRRQRPADRAAGTARPTDGDCAARTGDTAGLRRQGARTDMEDWSVRPTLFRPRSPGRGGGGHRGSYPALCSHRHR